MTTTGVRLKALRISRDLGVGDAARRVRMQRQQWQAYEADERHPRTDTLARIITGLRLSAKETYWLVTGISRKSNRFND